MDSNEIRNFTKIENFRFESKENLNKILKENPIFIFLDRDEYPLIAKYDYDKQRTVYFGKANLIKTLVFLISRRVKVELFSDTLANELVEAINEVLKTYNINLEETNGSNIQDKISGDGSPKS